MVTQQEVLSSRGLSDTSVTGKTPGNAVTSNIKHQTNENTLKLARIPLASNQKVSNLHYSQRVTSTTKVDLSAASIPEIEAVGKNKAIGNPIGRAYYNSNLKISTTAKSWLGGLKEMNSALREAVPHKKSDPIYKAITSSLAVVACTLCTLLGESHMRKPPRVDKDYANIPEKFRTVKSSTLALKYCQADDVNAVYQLIPDNIKNEGLALLALRRSGDPLRKEEPKLRAEVIIPNNDRPKDRVLIYQNTAKHLRTIKVTACALNQQAAAGNRPDAHKHLPKIYSLMPDSLKTEKSLSKLIDMLQTEPTAILYNSLSDSKRTKALTQKAIEHSNWDVDKLYANIPEKMKTPAITTKALEASKTSFDEKLPELFKSIPDSHKTESLVCSVISRIPPETVASLCSSISKQTMNERIVLKSLNHMRPSDIPGFLETLPEKLKTDKVLSSSNRT